MAEIGIPMRFARPDQCCPRLQNIPPPPISSVKKMNFLKIQLQLITLAKIVMGVTLLKIASFTLLCNMFR
jgi:hypothetical protein